MNALNVDGARSITTRALYYFYLNFSENFERNYSIRPRNTRGIFLDTWQEIINQLREDAQTELNLECSCPITAETFVDPVLASDGHTYERTAIQQWIDTGHQNSPISREPLQINFIKPNIAMRRIIAVLPRISELLLQ